MSEAGLLLDTCAVIWLGNRNPLKQHAVDVIAVAAADQRVFVSAISAWEIGQIGSRRYDHPRFVSFQPDVHTWFDRFLVLPGICETPLTPTIAIQASFLPGDFHPDPADRLLVATARDRNLAIITRDRAILAYAEAGHVRAIAC